MGEKMKKSISFIAVFLSFTLSVFGQNINVENLVNSKYVEELKINGKISIIHPKKENVIELVPECSYAEQIKSDLICETKSGVPFLAEFLYLIPKSELTDDVSKVNVETMCTVFRSISKMEGMTYIHNGGKEDILYEKAFAVPSADSMEKIPDPLEGPTDGLVAYAYQEDHSFGDTKYKLNYYQKDNIIFATFLNVIPMSKLGIKAVMPEHLRMNILSIDLGDNLLLYISADVSSKNIIGIRGQIEDSMTVRMDAIYRWFMKQFK